MIKILIPVADGHTGWYFMIYLVTFSEIIILSVVDTAVGGQTFCALELLSDDMYSVAQWANNNSEVKYRCLDSDLSKDRLYLLVCEIELIVLNLFWTFLLDI